MEAKPADSGPKDADRRQASGYAAEIGARYTVLTNGRRWEAWKIVPGKPRKESVFVEVSLATGDIPKLAAESSGLGGRGSTRRFHDLVWTTASSGFTFQGPQAVLGEAGPHRPKHARRGDSDARLESIPRLDGIRCAV